MGLESIESRYLDGRPVQNCADRTAAEVDEVVKKMLREAYEEAKNLLSQNIDALHRIAAYLIKKETITGKEFMDIYHEVLKEREENKKAAEAAEAQSQTEEDQTKENQAEENPAAEGQTEEAPSETRTAQENPAEKDQ